MNVYTCADHDGFWPAGTASVVIAADEAQAATLLGAALAERGLNPNEPFTLKQVPTDKPTVIILRDGNY